MNDQSPRPDETSTGSTSSSSSTAHAGNSARSGNPKWRTVAFVVVIVLIIAAIAAIFVQRKGDSDSAGGPVSSASAGDISGTSAAPAKKEGPVPAGCMKKPKPIVPVKYSIDGMELSAKVLSRGVDETGAAGAPPKNDPSSMAWFNKGPKIGSSEGRAVLTAHTFHKGGAIGNHLYDKNSGIKKGDIIRLTDKLGQTVCYRYDHDTKVMVKDYNPNSNVLYDNNGPAQAAIVICWDYAKKTGEFDSRIIFYAYPVA